MSRNIGENVLRVMHEHPGMHMTVGEVADVLLSKGIQLSRQQVTQALASRTNKRLLKRVSTGVYMYDPSDNGESEERDNEKDDGHIYETVGQLQDGSDVVRSDEGELYVLLTLDRHFGGG